MKGSRKSPHASRSVRPPTVPALRLGLAGCGFFAQNHLHARNVNAKVILHQRAGAKMHQRREQEGPRLGALVHSWFNLEACRQMGLSTCRQTDGFAPVVVSSLKLRCNTSSLTPHGHGFASERPMIGRRDEVTTGVEGVVDGTVG